MGGKSKYVLIDDTYTMKDDDSWEKLWKCVFETDVQKDTIEVIWSRKSKKDSQYNGKKGQTTKNYTTSYISSKNEPTK